jgi:putative spermidine/putrescine transport system permease protein
MVDDLAAPAVKRGRGQMTRQGFAGLALVAAPLVLLIGLVLVPTVSMVASTFHVSGDGAFSLAKYAAFFADDYSVENLRYTLVWTLISCVTALSISLGLALYLRFSEGRIATMIHALSLFPLFVPAIVISYAMVRFLGPNGLFQLLLEKVGVTGYTTPYLTPVGPYIAFVWESLPLPVLVLSAGLAQVSDHAIEAARDLGAGPVRIFSQILLPQLKRSLLIGFALIFLGVVGSFTVPYLLGPPAPEMMGVYMQRTLGNMRPEEAQVQAVILMAVAAIVGGFYIATMLRNQRSR